MPPDTLAPVTPSTAPAGAPSLRLDAPPIRLAPLQRRIWRDAGLAWLAQHLVFLIPIYLTIALAPSHPVTLQSVGLPWLNWDGWFYVDIAQHGYRTLDQAAFFPLYPLVTRVVAFVLGGNATLAALLVANTASLGAYGLLLLLVESEFGPVAARRTLLFLLCFPASYFLATAYTESLFLLLSVGAFLALRRQAWLAAGTLAALASLTRPVGILLLLPLAAAMALPYLRLPTGAPQRLPVWLRSFLLRGDVATQGHFPHERKSSKGLALLMPILALAGYCGYLALRFGQPFAFLTAEGGTWGRRASWPWDSFVRAASSVVHDPPNQAIPAALDLLLMALFIAATLLALRRLPFPYALYIAASLVLIVLLPMHRENWGALSSNKRFMVDVFPLFLVLGTTRPRRWIEPLAVVLALLLQVLLTVTFLQWGWVA